MKKREQIPEEYRWDIDMFKDPNEIEEVFKNIEKITEEQKKYDGRFNDKNVFFDYLNKYKAETIKIYQLDFYIFNSLSVDCSDVNMLKLNQRLSNALQKQSEALSFIGPQLTKLSDEYLLSLLKDKRIKGNENVVKEIIRSKPHEVDEKTSEIISKLGKSFSSSSSIFDVFTAGEMPFEDAVDSKGKKYKISDSSYTKYIGHSDRKLRESVYNSTMDAYGKFNKTFAEMFIKDLESENSFVKMYKYKNLLERRLFGEDISSEVFYRNLKNVQKNIPMLQKYVKLKAKINKLPKFAYYDLFMNEKKESKYSIPEAHKIILNALKPLGEEYLSIVKRKLSDKSIDYYPNLNKTSGAYCCHVYNAKTLILMNWADNFDSVSTLIHEMGHCINAEYFISNQSFTDANITTFCAETASTTNELLLSLYMQNISNKKDKLFFINELLNKVRSSIFRQTLFSEFELFAHNSIENEIPITYKELNDKYYELNKKYYGNSCVLPKNLQYEWSRIPHFYNPYYVYSYSTGLIIAINIVMNIIEDKEYHKKYIYFLKNGTKKPPLEILKEIGINLETDEPFEKAFKFINNQLNQMIELSK